MSRHAETSQGGNEYRRIYHPQVKKFSSHPGDNVPCMIFIEGCPSGRICDHSIEIMGQDRSSAQLRSASTLHAPASVFLPV